MIINRKSYNENGFVILKKFFPKDRIQRILTDAKIIFFNQFKYKGYTSQESFIDLTEDEFNACLYRMFNEDLLALSNCGKQVQHLISLHRLSIDTTIEELLIDVGLLSPVISTRPVLYFNHSKLAQKKVFYKVDAHQDWRSMQGSLNSVVIWVPLIDINKDIGALEVLSGSHLKGLRTDHMENGFGMVGLTQNEMQELQSVELEVGDILLFSSFLIHQSGENVTNRPRWSCHFRYNDLNENTFIARKYAHPYIYKPQEDLITSDFPDLQQIDKIFRNSGNEK